MSIARIGTHFIWALIALLSVGVAGYALFHVTTGFEHLELDNNFPSPLGLETHIAASAFAMLIGPFQFLKVLRSRLSGIHRWMGRFYIAACLVGGVAGSIIALYSGGGLAAGLGFLSLALVWLFTTLMAWFSALRRDFAAHERWMIRSFALTFAAVTLRLYIPSVLILQWEFWPAYRIIAWACWVPNLVIAELWIALRRKPKRPKVAPTAVPA